MSSRSAGRMALLCIGVLLAGCDWGRSYVSVGDVVESDRAAQQASIRHEAVPGLMDAATTRFAVASDDLQAALVPGTRVRFVLRRRDGQLILTGVTVLASGGSPGLHDHTPHHGGIVAMAGMIHLEAIASPDGQLVLYLTDLWRRPLPLDDVSGTVTIDAPDGKRALPLVRVGDVLTAAGGPLAGANVNVRYELRREDEPVEVSFLLPLANGTTGAAGVPVGGCAVPTPAGSGRAQPRCALSFAKSVVALATTPDAATLLVAMVDLGISAWHLPAAEFAVGFAPPPAVALPVPEAPHPEAPNAVVVRPDGREVVVAMENRLILYAIDTGRVSRAFVGPGGIVRAVSWSPDGTALLVSTFYTAAGFLLDANDGHVLRRFPVEREGAAVAFAPDGRRVAVASENGPIALFALGATTPPLMLRGAHAAARGLAFTGARLAAVADDGVLRVFDAVSGAVVIERRLGTAVRTVAFDVPRGLLASAELEPRVQLTRLSDGTPLGTLDWHSAQILSLAWAGETLISGDAAGRVAFWEVADETPTVTPSGSRPDE